MLMLQCDRWLAGDAYAIELEDGRRVPLEGLLTAARRERSLEVRRLLAGGAKRLAMLVAWPFLRPAETIRERRKAPLNPAKTICSTTDYRTDAALGHIAGETSDTPVQPIATGTASEPFRKIAA